MRVFRDRREAGQALASKLHAYANRLDAIVLGLPRGGVPVAFELMFKEQLVDGSSLRGHQLVTIAKTFLQPANRKVVPAGAPSGGWTTAVAVAEGSQPGHEFMPSLAFAGGKLMLLIETL